VIAPVFVGLFVEWRAQRRNRVIDQDVDAPGGGLRLAHETLDILQPADIRLDRPGLDAQRPDIGRGLVQGFARAPAKRDIHPLPGERQGNRPANTPAAAGYQRDALLQAKIHP
jgi:hypothetical protein